MYPTHPIRDILRGILSRLWFTGLMLIWSVLYYASAYISFKLDEPIGYWGLVWLPAGIVVSAYLRTTYRHWPLLTLVFLASHIILDIQSERNLFVSQTVAITTIASGITIAFLVKSRRQWPNNLSFLIRWILLTLIISLFAAIIGTAWLKFFDGVPFKETAIVWWISNVTGIILLTPILTDFDSQAPKISFVRTQYAGVGTIILLCGSASYIFSTARADIHTLETTWDILAQLTLFATPIVLLIATIVLSGARLGTIALFCLCMVALYNTFLERGPFSFSSLRQNGSLLLVQSYLIASALLVALFKINVLSTKITENYGSPSTQFMYYRIQIQSGKIEWDRPPRIGLGQEGLRFDTVKEILKHVHPDDRLVLKNRFSDKRHRVFDNNAVSFRLANKSGQWTRVFDHHTARINDRFGGTIVGHWELA